MTSNILMACIVTVTSPLTNTVWISVKDGGGSHWAGRDWLQGISSHWLIIIRERCLCWLLVQSCYLVLGNCYLLYVILYLSFIVWLVSSIIYCLLFICLPKVPRNLRGISANLRKSPQISANLRKAAHGRITGITRITRIRLRRPRLSIIIRNICF